MFLNIDIICKCKIYTDEYIQWDEFQNVIAFDWQYVAWWNIKNCTNKNNENVEIERKKLSFRGSYATYSSKLADYKIGVWKIQSKNRPKMVRLFWTCFKRKMNSIWSMPNINLFSLLNYSVRKSLIFQSCTFTPVACLHLLLWKFSSGYKILW